MPMSLDSLGHERGLIATGSRISNRLTPRLRGKFPDANALDAWRFIPLLMRASERPLLMRRFDAKRVPSKLWLYMSKKLFD